MTLKNYNLINFFYLPTFYSMHYNEFYLPANAFIQILILYTCVTYYYT